MLLSRTSSLQGPELFFRNLHQFLESGPVVFYTFFTSEVPDPDPRSVKSTEIPGNTLISSINTSSLLYSLPLALVFKNNFNGCPFLF